MTNIEPKFELLADCTNEMPANRDRVGDPGRLPGNFFDLAHRGLCPLERSRVGQLDVDDQPALVLLGDETCRSTG